MGHLKFSKHRIDGHTRHCELPLQITPDVVYLVRPHGTRVDQSACIMVKLRFRTTPWPLTLLTLALAFIIKFADYGRNCSV